MRFDSAIPRNYEGAILAFAEILGIAWDFLLDMPGMLNFVSTEQASMALGADKM